MEIKEEEYSVFYDPETATVFCSGLLRLMGKAGYRPIAEVLEKVRETEPAVITLDLRELELLNSPGISTISEFVIRVRNQKASRLVVRCTRRFPWQEKSLYILQRLMPDVEMVYE